MSLASLIAQAKLTAAARSDGFNSDGFDEGSLDVASLRKELVKSEALILSLRKELKEKDDLCKEAETMLKRLLPLADTPIISRSDSKTLNKNGTTYDLSEEYFRSEYHSWKSQVWFSHMAPPVVDAAFEKLAAGLPDLYIGRTHAITSTECFNIVNELRRTWEMDLPKLIVKELEKCSNIYTSHSDARERKRGQKCDAVHFLIFITNKLFNKAAQVFLSIKKEANLHSHRTNVSNDLTKEDDDDGSSSEKIKWKINPSTEHLVEEARLSLSKTNFESVSGIEDALKTTVSKLTAKNNKPKLTESLSYLASIIALQEAAKLREWTINTSILKHREILEFKMLEHWHQISFRKTYDDYRKSIFCCITSMLMYMYICGSSDVEPLLRQLQTALKPLFRAEFDSAFLVLLTSKDVAPMFNILRILASSNFAIDCGGFFPKVFVCLMRFLSVMDDAPTLHETVLLNLLHDMPCSDISKLSSFERNDNVKVLSLIATSILEGTREAPVNLTGNRRKYVEAAFYLGDKLNCLLKIEKLTVMEENFFWNSIPVEGMGSLLDLCPPTAIQGAMQAGMYNIRLPKLHGNETLATAMATVTALKSPAPCIVEATEVAGGIATLVTRNSKSFKYMKLPQLRETLSMLGLPSAGRKKDLQKRLVEEAGYTDHRLVGKLSGSKRRRMDDAYDKSVKLQRHSSGSESSTDSSDN